MIYIHQNIVYIKETSKSIVKIEENYDIVMIKEKRCEYRYMLIKERLLSQEDMTSVRNA